MTREKTLMGSGERSIGGRVPAELLPEKTIIAPHIVLRGWLIYDGQIVRSAGPYELIDGDQTLTQTFEGSHAGTYP